MACAHRRNVQPGGQIIFITIFLLFLLVSSPPIFIFLKLFSAAIPATDNHVDDLMVCSEILNSVVPASSDHCWTANIMMQ
ncbi:hypothetical protein BDV12DRAFT_66378 [Aspergillus spectabilis]